MRAHPGVRIAACGVLVLSSVSCSGGGGDGGGITPPPPPETVVMSGKIFSQSTGLPVVSAQVAVGSITSTTGTDGSYSLRSVPPGSAKFIVTATGFDEWREDIVVPSSSFTKDVRLLLAEHFTVGSNFSMFVPASVKTVSAVIIALGGPDTRGFVSASFNVTDSPDNATVNQQLNNLALSLQSMAVNRKLAILGSRIGGGDDALIAALSDAAQATGHPEITTAPVLVLGISAGGPGAASFASHNSSRIVGLYLRVPASPEALTEMPPVQFPAYAVMTEGDVMVDNSRTTQIFRSLRTAGWPIAVATERGVMHYGFSIAQQALAIAWMNDILQARLSSGVALNPTDLPTGWLGNPVTREIAAWNAYTGTRADANWFPTQSTAEQWAGFSR